MSDPFSSKVVSSKKILKSIIRPWLNHPPEKGVRFLTNQKTYCNILYKKSKRVMYKNLPNWINDANIRSDCSVKNINEWLSYRRVEWNEPLEKRWPKMAEWKLKEMNYRLAVEMKRPTSTSSRINERTNSVIEQRSRIDQNELEISKQMVCTPTISLTTSPSLKLSNFQSSNWFTGTTKISKVKDECF